MERALAHVEEIAWIKPIEGADNIEAVGVLGWNLIARKGEFKVGDKCVFFEIDSKLPETEWSEFLRPKGFKIKTLKLNRFKVWSQGLALPLTVFPEFQTRIPEVGTDVTNILSVTYSVQEDNIRKAKPDPDSAFKSISARHPKLAQKPLWRWLSKRKWGKKLLVFIFNRKRSDPKAFPDWITKTDETRIENIPFILDGNGIWTVTEKLDGTSSTFGVKKIGRNKYDFAVCSRNVRQIDEDQETYHDSNIYWEMANKYGIKDKLISFAKEHGYDTVVLQGEGIGNVQKNPYKLKENDLYCFNLYINGTRISTAELQDFCIKYGFKCVPILMMEHELPKTMEEMKLEADGTSVINPNVKREGLVYRSLDGQQSFKNVSREYLLKHEG